VFITRGTAHAVAHAQRDFVNQLNSSCVSAAQARVDTDGRGSATGAHFPAEMSAPNAIGRLTEIRKFREVR